MPRSINLFRAVDSLSRAVDLVGVDDIQHGKRVGFMAYQVARHLGCGPERQRSLLYAGFLHDCGVSTTDEHGHLVSELEWSNAQAHCRRGAALLQSVPLLAPLAPLVLFHHTGWASPLLQCQPSDVAQGANLIFLVDRLDALRAGLDPIEAFERRGRLLETLSRHAGSLFMPELVAALDYCSQSAAFWFSQAPELLELHLHETMGNGDTRSITPSDLKALALMFARIIDAKSPFTAQHSEKVAALATVLAADIGLAAGTVEMIEIAGYLHDLGKLRVPDSILEKSGPLDAQETLVMRRHAFDTYEVLFRLLGDDSIARWASFHHETLNGSGYPFRLSAPDLPLPARIIAVADIFQALVQTRPYRSSLPPAEIIPIMESMAAQGHIDRAVLDTLFADIDRYWLVAGGDPRHLHSAA